MRYPGGWENIPAAEADEAIEMTEFIVAWVKKQFLQSA